MLCGIPNALLSHAMKGNCSYYLGTCDTFSGIHNCVFLKNIIQRLEHLQKCLKSSQIKNEPVAMNDCANNIWAVDLRLQLYSWFL